MKNLFIMAVAAVSMMVASSASANMQDISVLSVKQFANFMPPLPPGGPRSRTTIEISFISCAQFGDQNFDVALAAEGGDSVPMLVVAFKPGTYDCMSTGRLHKATLVRGNMPLLEKVLVQQNGKQVELTVDQQIVH